MTALVLQGKRAKAVALPERIKTWGVPYLTYWKAMI